MSTKNYIPIAFCFDDNLIMPAGICISSLLENAKDNTFYDIFILHDNIAKYPNSGFLERLYDKYQNFRINYRNVGDQFDNAFEIRGITKATYYRLLIPELIKEYKKIFYFDVDIIFQNDLSEIYFNTDLKDYYAAGVATPYTGLNDYIIEKIKVEPNKYVCGGTLILNSEKLLTDNIIPEFKRVANQDWKFQDQDVLNLVCKNKILMLPPWFGVIGTINEIVADKNQTYYSQEEISDILENGIIHFNGDKPWKNWCYNFDIWWFYYRHSIYFDSSFYFNFFHKKLFEYDQLSLFKRIKILVRYFTHRKK